ncbi:hypothetical protein [Salinibacillus xinjiangensis]|uniref:Uncharacterized protein n=1 Tax=Salinibacillus xinjiangensis TaxID=1229268 RepID=A0A6G1X6R6_9BACI|nr:hypothetical protein [Salinibacillus xinjiangensis]MRG86619.1 hypothetical protein [Salinibacillus xinjiangensis]
MQQDRKHVILNELQYWKKNRMLPDVYCDYLIALYSEGQGIDHKKKKARPKRFSKLLMIVDLIFLLLLIPFSFLIIHFTEINLGLQIGLLILLLTIGIIHLYFFLSLKKT